MRRAPCSDSHSPCSSSSSPPPRAARARPASRSRARATSRWRLPAAARPSFFDSGIRKALAAHIALGNLEGTLATGGSSKCGSGSPNCFAFRAPPSYSTALKQAGFTIMNLANNHALDYGDAGQAETIAALKRAGLRFTGRPGEIAVLERGGTKVAFVGFAPYPWAQSLLDIEDAVKLVRKADRKADVVVVTMHAGAEGSDQQHVQPGPEIVPRRAARQRLRVLARRRPCRRGSRRRPRAARPPRDRVVPRTSDRLQPRQLPRQRHAERLRRLRPDRGAARNAAPRRLVGGGQARARCS